MWRCPEWIEDALWSAARARLPGGALARPLLVRSIEQRSRRYTSEREQLTAPAGPEDLAARALFFSVADATKVMVPLAELRGRGGLPAHRPLRVLDVGAGAGAMSLGAAAALDTPLDVLAVDRDARALSILEHALGERARVQTQVVELASWRPEGEYDLVLAGTVLNELGPDERLPLARALIGALGPDGAVILIEPALRETARELHRLRDAVLAEGAAFVFAPCVRAGAPCPMLADERDWCHEDRPVVLPPRTRDLAAATGLRDEGMKFAYLVLRRQPTPLVPPPPEGRRALRVVSQPFKPKGKIELYGCGDQGRTLVRLLRRHRAPANRAFERARRGDVIVTGGADELARDDAVHLIRPADSD